MIEKTERRAALIFNGGLMQFDTAPLFSYDTVPAKFVWESIICLDMAWVASAQPWGKMSDGSHAGTEIIMCGGSERQVVRCDFSEFMGLWMCARTLLRTDNETASTPGGIR